MDYQVKNQRQLQKINTEVQKLTDFEKQDNPFYTFVPQKYAEGQQRRAEPAMNKAIRDNQLIGYALTNSQQFNLDVKKKARLRSMKNRNTAHILLNLQRYRKDSPEMVRVKDAVAEVESMLAGNLWEPVNETNPKEIAQLRARSLDDKAIKYQDAINACKDYLKGRNPSTPKGIARYNLVYDTMGNMIAEMNRLYFARQMVYRGRMGQDTQTLRDLLVETDEYMQQSGTYTDEEKTFFNNEVARIRTYYNYGCKIDADDVDIKEELRLFYDAVTLRVPADMLVKNYGKNSKDRRAARKLIITLRDTLSRLHEGDKDCFSMLVGKTVVNIFQKEDGSLDIGYCYRNGEGSLIAKQDDLGITAMDLAHKLGVNMVENENVFGKANTAKILHEVEPIRKDMSYRDKARYTETATAFLRSRLQIPNIKLTNIPADRLVRWATLMSEGLEKPESVLEKINRFEYENKEKSKAERERQIRRVEDKARRLDLKAQREGFDNIEALEKSYIEKDKARENAPKEEKWQGGEPVELPEEARRLEEVFAGMEKQYNDEAMDLKNAALIRYRDEVSKKLIPQKEALEQKIKRFEERKKNGENEEAQVISRSDMAKSAFATQYRQLQLNKEDDLQRKLEQDLHDAEQRLSGNEEELEKEKERLRAEFDQNKKNLDEQTDTAIKSWCNVQDRKLERRTKRLDRRRKKASDDLVSINARIAEEKLKYETDTHNADIGLKLKMSALQKDRDSYNTWKAYYVKQNTISDFEVVEKNGNTHAAAPLSFAEWNEKRVKEKKEEELREKEEEEIRKRHMKMVEEYKEAKGDLEELRDSDLPTITDFKVNGKDTLELLDLRKRYADAGTLEDKVIDADAYEERCLAEAQRKKKEADEGKESTGKKITELELEIKGQSDLLEINTQKRAELASQKEIILAFRDENADEKVKAIDSKLEELTRQEQETGSNIERLKKELNDNKKNNKKYERVQSKQEEAIKSFTESIEKRAHELEEERRKAKERQKNGFEASWTWDEEQFLDLISELLYARNTWDMDNEKSPAIRLFNIFSRNALWFGTWLSEPEKTKAKLNAMADKLPLAALGIDKEFITKDLFEYIDKGYSYIEKPISKKIDEANKREEERNKKREQKRAEIEERKRLRAEEWAKNPQVIADLEEEKRDKEEEEEDRKKAEELERQELKKEEESRKAYQEEHDLDGMLELESMAGKKIEKQEVKKTEKKPAEKAPEKKEEPGFIGNLGAGFMKFFKFVGNQLVGEDEKPETEEEKRERLRKERKEDREERKAERERLAALQDAEWEKEIEESARDEFYDSDKALIAGKDLMMKASVSVRLNMIKDPENDVNFQKLVELQKNMDQKIHRYLRDSRDKVAQFISNSLGAAAETEVINPVPYYREEGIPQDERKRRIDLGNEELSKMIRNAMVGDEGEGQFVRNVLSEYFGQSSILDVRSMFASAIRSAKPVRLPENATDEQKYRALAPMLGGLFKGAGPLLQKILQGMPDSMIPKGLESAFDDCKSNLAPIPKEIVEAQLLSMVERSDGMIRRIEIVKSLGAASVGQAFLCRIHTQDRKKEVVIKLLRPDVRNRMLRERKIMEKCASKVGKGMEKTYKGLLTRYLEELDLTIEARNTDLGRIYDMDRNVESMKVSSMVNPTPNSMVVNRAPGETVVNVLKNSRQERDDLLGRFYQKDQDGKLIMEGNNPKLFIDSGADIQQLQAKLSGKLSVLQDQQKMLCKLATKWVDEAVFGEGYYHGDLHSGNIMMSGEKLTVIDFGNATKLDTYQQEKITLMLIAAAAGSGSGFYEGFVSLLGEDSQKLLETRKEDLKAVFKEVMKLGDYHSSAERIAAALVRAQKLGFELPPAIYGFQQCQIRLQNTIASFNNEIKEMQKIIRKLSEAERNAVFSVKSEYDRLSKDSPDNASRLRMVLLSDKDDEIRTLLQIRDKDVRNRLNMIFKADFDVVKDVLQMEPEMRNTAYMSQDNLNRLYDNLGKNLIDRQAWDKVLTDNGFNINDDKFDERLDGMPKEEKYRMMTELVNLAEPYDILGQMEKVWKAQDEGKSEAEIKALEDEAVECFKRTRTKYVQTAEKTIRDKISKKNYSDEEKSRLLAEYEKFFDQDKLFAPIKEKLLDPEKITQVENELKPLFENPYYGIKLKDAFEAYKKAPADAANRQELASNVIEAYRMPVLMTMTHVTQTAYMSRFDRGEPATFVDVMGNVINEKWFTALKRVNIYKSIKYGIRIKGDIDGVTLSSKDMIKMAARILWGKE